MNKQKTWGPAGWPWELELLALVFVITALAIPFWLNVQQTPDPSEMSLYELSQMERRSDTATFEDQKSFFWAVAIVGLYVVHLLMAYSAIDMISTSFTHLFSPLVFSMITYFRLLGLEDKGASAHIVSGKPLEAAFWFMGVLLITMLVARIRMARHMLRFKQIEWDVVSPSRFDGTFLSDLAVTFRPLVYPPRAFRACEEGILIEGWLYILPLSFNAVQSVESVKRASYTSSAQFYATSTKTLVRIQLTESKVPIFISPADRDQFIAYCNRRLSRGVVTLARDTSRGDDDD